MSHSWLPFGESGSNFTPLPTLVAIAQAVSRGEVETAMVITTMDCSERGSHHIKASRKQLIHLTGAYQPLTRGGAPRLAAPKQLLTFRNVR